MRRKIKIVALFTGFILLLALAGYRYSRSDYQRKSLHTWLTDTNLTEITGILPFLSVRDEEDLAPFRAAGKRGVRYLSRKLSPPSYRYTQTFHKLPKWLQKLAPKPKDPDFQRKEAALVLAGLGPASSPVYAKIKEYLFDSKLKDRDEKAFLVQNIPLICRDREEAEKDLDYLLRHSREHIIRVAAAEALSRYRGDQVFYTLWPDPDLAIESTSFLEEAAISLVLENTYAGIYFRLLALTLLPHHFPTLSSYLATISDGSPRFRTTTQSLFFGVNSYRISSYGSHPLPPTIEKNKQEFRTLLKDPDLDVRLKAARGLTNIDKDAWPDALPVFVEAACSDPLLFESEFSKVPEKGAPLSPAQLSTLEAMSQKLAPAERKQSTLIIGRLKDFTAKRLVEQQERRDQLLAAFKNPTRQPGSPVPVAGLTILHAPKLSTTADGPKKDFRQTLSQATKYDAPFPDDRFSVRPAVRNGRRLFYDQPAFNAAILVDSNPLSQGREFTVHVALRVVPGKPVRSIGKPDSIAGSEIILHLPVGIEATGPWKASVSSNFYTGLVFLERRYRVKDARPGHYHSQGLVRVRGNDPLITEEQGFVIPLKIEK